MEGDLTRNIMGALWPD